MPDPLRTGMNLDPLKREAVRAYAAATGLGCALLAPDGSVLFESGTPCDVCALGPGTLPDCAAAHRSALGFARRFGGQYAYLCPGGLAYFASPLTDMDTLTAGLRAGPALLVPPEDFLACELDGAAPAGSALHACVMQLPQLEPRRASALAHLLFMTASFLGGAREAERLREAAASDSMQGQISAYLHGIKQAESAPYPYEKEKALLDAMSHSRRKEANRLLNELLGHILLISGMSFERMKSHINELTVLMSRRALENGADPRQVREATYRAYRRLVTIQGFEELCIWLGEVMNGLISAAFAFGDTQHAGVIRRAVGHIRAHISQPLTLKAVSDEAYLSPAYFSRVFKRETGLSVEQFITQERMRRAADLLWNREMPLAAVAQAVGIQSVSQFSRMFRAAYGMAPGAYRRNLPD